MDDANIKHIGWDDLDKRKFYIFGPSLMVGARLLIFPPILIKTRLQVQRKSSLYNGTFDAFRKIYRYEGVRGFYKGFGTNTFTILSGQIYVSVFEVSRASLSNVNETCKNLIAGLFASIIGQTITVPIDIISQKQMVTGQRLDVSSVISKRDYKSRSAWSVILEISKTSGLRGFYKGYVASLLTYAPGSSIWWASYYVFTQFLGDSRPSGMPDILIQGMSGSAASFVSAVCTNPADVVRTRLQVEGGKETILSVCRNLYYEEGVSGCYKGLTARLTSSMPSGFFIIATYELIKNLSKKEDQG